MASPTPRSSTGKTAREREAISLVIAGRAWVGGRLQPVEIGIDEHGRIASIGRSQEGEERHDVGESVLLPAATDLHVHLRDPPGDPGTESISSGTVAAALGGVGLVGEMPNTEPAVTTAERLAEKAGRVERRSAIDIVLFAATSNRKELRALARSAGAFKIFLSPTTSIERPVPADELPELLRVLAHYDLPVSVHAEDPERFSSATAPANPTAWNASRPPAAEKSAIDTLLAAAPPGLRLHIAHVTTAESAERLRNRSVSFEVTPHHLLLSDRSGSGPEFKVNPPLRGEATRSALWEWYRSGRVPCVASDHAPHSAEAKAQRFASAPSGVPGVQTMLPLLLAQVRAGELPLEVLLSSACDRPARWFGQPVGRLAVGHRANFLVVDFRRRSTIRGPRLASPCGWTPFEGREAIFPVEHWRDGVRIVQDGEYVGRHEGVVVRPEFAVGRTEPDAPAVG